MFIRIFSLLSLLFALSSSGSADGETEKVTLMRPEAVQAFADRVWADAEKLDMDTLFVTSSDSDDYSFFVEGLPLWGKPATVAFFKDVFTGVARQELAFDKEKVVILSDKFALYSGTGTYRQFDDSGTLVFEGPHIISMVIVLEDGEMKIFHAHQSYPMEADAQ